MKQTNSISLLPGAGTNETLFHTNGDGLFNASSLAREYGKDVYGYTRSQKVRDFIMGVCLEYGLDPDQEFTEKGNLVRVISGGTSPGTWMHLDIFIKFLDWLDPKLGREFLKSAFAARGKQDDPLQQQLAQLEAEITSLKKKLSRNPLYRDLLKKEKEAVQLQKEIDKGNKCLRKRIAGEIKKQPKALLNAKA
ncbi:KilA-N domain-containing protein [Dysgonomonas sp. GY75]|uniref:KilA-N domain-containing protein n=1 Tax=Dysgonomonas sp. GY75 TaxID=2780419 RepID=UPI00188434A5|nr:KilA-N domain-containing protein [Dysgonomonas sp. GY75]MBF0649139.1 KilA-N domain-containing protein [Dysgonomonas sp. GY75]